MEESSQGPTGLKTWWLAEKNLFHTLNLLYHCRRTWHISPLCNKLYKIVLCNKLKYKRRQVLIFRPDAMKIYNGVVVIFIIQFIQMNAARIEDSRATEVSRARILHTAVNIHHQDRIQRFLQKRYLKIDFLTLYKINLLAACAKVKRR